MVAERPPNAERAFPSTLTRLADGLGPKRLPYAGCPAIRPLRWVPRSRPPGRDSAFCGACRNAEILDTSWQRQPFRRTSYTTKHRRRKGERRCHHHEGGGHPYGVAVVKTWAKAVWAGEVEWRKRGQGQSARSMIFSISSLVTISRSLVMVAAISCKFPSFRKGRIMVLI